MNEILKERYNALITEFGADGAPKVAGMLPKDIEAAFAGDEKLSEKLKSFLDCRDHAYETYSEEYGKLLMRLERLIVETGSASSAAKLIGESGSTVSDIRKCKYRGNVPKFFGSLASYFKTKEEKKKEYKGVKYVPTSISETVFYTIRNCHVMGDCEIIVGDSGIGKTRAVRKYADTYPSDTIVVTASSGTGNALSLLNEIGAQLGIPEMRRIDKLEKAVISRLHDGMLIIVDEAQHLRFRAADELRQIADHFTDNGETVGVCFVANPAFMKMFSDAKLDLTGQIWNRSHLRPNLRSSDIKLDDIKLLFPKLVDEHKNAELIFLHEIAKVNGEGIRRAVNFYKLEYANTDGNVTLEGLAALAQNGGAKISSNILKRLKEEAA